LGIKGVYTFWTIWRACRAFLLKETKNYSLGKILGHILNRSKQWLIILLYQAMSANFSQYICVYWLFLHSMCSLASWQHTLKHKLVFVYARALTCYLLLIQYTYSIPLHKLHKLFFNNNSLHCIYF